MSEIPAVQRFLGALLIGVGGLIAVLSGGCTLVMVGFSLTGSSAGETMSILPLALLFGAPPFAVGAGLFFLGLRLYRGPKKPPPVSPGAFD